MSDDLVFDNVAPEPEPSATMEPTPEPVVEPEVEPETPVEPEEESEEESFKKKTGSQRWKEKANFYKEEADALRQKLAEVPTPKPPSVGRPDLSDFDTHDDWVEAVAEWKADKKIAELKQREQHEVAVKGWEQKAQEARKEIPDFDEMLENAPPPSRVVADSLMDSPVGAKVAYYLATHPSEYDRINKLSERAAVREITLLETKLDKPKPETKKTTQAPKPPTPVAATVVAPKLGDGRMEVY